MRILAAAVLSLILAPAAFALPDAGFDGGAGAPLRFDRPALERAVSGEPADPRSWVTVRAGDAALRTAAADAGLSIEEVRPGEVSGIATPEALARLRAAGLAVLFERDLRSQFARFAFPRRDAEFHDYAETLAAMRRLAQEAPELVSLISLGRSLQGRGIWALRLNSDAQGDERSPKPGIVFMGAHHAREHLSVDVPLRLAQRLVERRLRPEIARLLRERDIYFVPMVNPDGAEHDIASGEYRMHRKNMRENADGSLGVDLNRNYARGWGGPGASPHPGDDTYRGPAAFSEPETQAIKAFIEARPNLKVLLSYHTYSELILYPWGGTREPLEDPEALAAYRAMAQEMAGMTGYTPMQSSGLYVASGDTCDWAWAEHGVFSFTFELTPKSFWDGGFYPGAAAIASTVEANWRPLLYLLEMADDPRRAGRGVAAATPRAHGG